MTKGIVVKLLYTMCFSSHPVKLSKSEGVTARKYSENLILFKKGKMITFYRCTDLSDLNQE